MKKMGLYMNLLMSITMSLFLSFANSMASGHFTVLGYLIGLAVSFLISLTVGFLVPMEKVTGAACRKAGLSREKYSTRFFEAMISDVIYTPVMTLAMVTVAYRNASSHGVPPPFLPMLGKSMLLSLVLGYLLALFFMPIFKERLAKKFVPPHGEDPKAEDRQQ